MQTKLRMNGATVADLVRARKAQALSANPMYQRGLCWTRRDQQLFIDSILRGFPVPTFYLHVRPAQGLFGGNSAVHEIVDGQQRIEALTAFSEGKFALLDPATDKQYPAFAKGEICPWAGRKYSTLESTDRAQLEETKVVIHEIVSEEVHEVRDLFIRLQGGRKLSLQEKRDAWPGSFTDFVLEAAGKEDHRDATEKRWLHAGHPLFRETTAGTPGQKRQFVAQLFLLWRAMRGQHGMVSTKSSDIDRLYNEERHFARGGREETEFKNLCNEVQKALEGRKKLARYWVLHTFLLMDKLRAEYGAGVEERIGEAISEFENRCQDGKAAAKDNIASEHVIYEEGFGVWTRTSSDTPEYVERRHAFFLREMLKLTGAVRKDPTRGFTGVEREAVFLRDGRKCQVCVMKGERSDMAKVEWNELEVHHITPHSEGGQTEVSNGVSVHPGCHPKGSENTAAFKSWWEQRKRDTKPPQEGKSWGTTVEGSAWRKWFSNQTKAMIGLLAHMEETNAGTLQELATSPEEYEVLTGMVVPREQAEDRYKPINGDWAVNTNVSRGPKEAVMRGAWRAAGKEEDDLRITFGVPEDPWSLTGQVKALMKENVF